MKHIKYLQQLSETGCGIAALAMILNYYDCKIHVAELSKESNISRDGVSLRELIRIADNYGFLGKAVQLREKDLINSISEVFPCIAVIENNHYVVIDQTKDSKIVYFDPQIGKVELPIEDFNNIFTGIILYFKKNREQVNKRSGSYIFSFLKTGFVDRKIVFTVIVLSIIVQLFTLITPMATRFIIDDFVSGNVNSNIGVLLTSAFVFVLLYGVFSYIRLMLIHVFEKKYISTLKQAVVDKIFKLPLKFFDVRSIGDIVSRINGIDSLQQVMTNLFISLFVDLTTVIIVLIAMLRSSIVLSIITLILAMILSLFLVIFLKIMDNKNVDSIYKREKTQSYLIESLSNVSVLKTLGVRDAITNKWKEYYGKQIQSEYKRENALGFYQSFMIAYRMLPTFIILLVGSSMIVNGEMTIGRMMEFVSLANLFLSPLSVIIQNVFDFQYSATIIDRLSEIMYEDEESFAGEMIYDFHSLNFSNISFSYVKNDSERTINDISFSLRKGEIISFVGKTGCGKTTIVKLILSLYRPDEGYIFLNSKKLSDYNLKSYRHLFGIVLQNEFFFNDSIRNNVDLARTHTDEEIMDAIKMACFDEDVKKMPFKLNTQIGDNGSNLSGGQRQRLAIARMLINKPQIVILDEGTNQLDALTERKILNRLKDNNISLITITHRLSTISASDRVYFIENGIITDSGKYAELCDKNDECRKLLIAQ